MLLRYLALATVALLPALWVACDETPNGCEEAKKYIETKIKMDICADPTYAGSPFCTCCVEHGFYSVSNDCTCRALLLDTDACYYATGDQALPQARDAVEYANNICQGRTVGVPYMDAGTLHAPCGPASGTTSSSSSASSGMQGTGGAGMATTSSSGKMATSSSGMSGTGGAP